MMSKDEGGLFDNVYEMAMAPDRSALDSVSLSLIELADVSEKYTEQVLIGKGAVKEVYRAYDVSAKRYVAYTIPKEGLEPSLLESFVHEAWLATSLQHPNIIKVYDVGMQEDGTPFFTMELKGNRTLTEYLKEDRRLEEKLSVFETVCDALSYAHSQSIVHLDLKPDNIQCEKRGEVIVCDWGLGKSLDAGSKQDDQNNHLYYSRDMTLMGQVKGSLGFMSPEQADGNGEKGIHSDIFSLGCILFYILTGEALYQGSVTEVLAQTSQGVSSWRGDRRVSSIPVGLRALLLRTLAKDPQERYASVDELKADLERYRENVLLEAEKPNVLRGLFLFTKRNQFVLGLFSFFALIIVGGWQYFQVQQEIADRDLSLKKLEMEQLGEQLSDLSQTQSAIESLLMEGKTENQYASDLVKKSQQFVEEVLRNQDEQRAVEYLQNAKALLKESLRKNKSSEHARSILIQLSFYEMDFRSILEYANTERSSESVFVKYAQEFPSYQFSATNRPSVEQLMSVVRFAQQSRDLISVQICIMIEYYYNLRSPEENYNPLILQFLRYVNSFSHAKVKTEYNPELSSALITSDKGISFSGRNIGDSLLRYLELRELVIECPEGHFLPAYLSGLKVQKLDISKIKHFSFNFNEWGDQAEIPGLKEVVVNQRQYREKQLQEYFKQLNPDIQLVLAKEWGKKSQKK